MPGLTCANLRPCLRLKEKHQSGDDSGDDEDGYALSGQVAAKVAQNELGLFIDALSAGHVEKTNDRDYEVEERCELTPRERKRSEILENL